MRIIPLVLILLIIFTGCQSVSISVETIDTTSMEEQTMDERKQLTPEELIEMANIPEGMYEIDFLERFIARYFLTEKNFDASKIERLLARFEEYEGMKNVQSIFREETTDIVPTDPKAITVIAFYENINTGIESVYYDFQTLECYRGIHCNIFSNLTKVQPRAMDQAEADSLRKILVDQNVLSWVNTTSNEEIDDPQAMCIAIRFDDGSLFRAYASGLLSENALNHYREVRDLLLGD